MKRRAMKIGPRTRNSKMDSETEVRSVLLEGSAVISEKKTKTPLKLMSRINVNAYLCS